MSPKWIWGSKEALKYTEILPSQQKEGYSWFLKILLHTSYWVEANKL